MALTSEQRKIRLEERQIGKKAEQVVESYVKRRIARRLTIRNKGGLSEAGKVMPPILQASKIRAKIGSHRLLGLNLTSNTYGFIHHFGVSKKRAEHLVQLNNAKRTTFVRRSHPFKLKEKSLFDDVYEKSGALEILADGLSKTRVEAVVVGIKALVLKLNRQNG